MSNTKCSALKRRDFLFNTMALGGLGLSSLTWPHLSSAQSTPTEPTVRIGYLPIADATALLVAHAKGYFTDEGLKVAPPEPVKSWTALVRGFFTQQYNLVHLLKPIPIWMRYHFDIPIKIVSWAHINGSALVTGAHIKANSFADLGGRHIAVPYWFSMHNIVLQMALRHVGLTPVMRRFHEKIADHEVNLRVLPPPIMVWALEARNIDAYIVAEPINVKGELNAGARLLRFTGDMWRNHPCCVVCMNEQELTQQPAWSQKVLNAIVRAQIFAQQNKLETAKILSKEGQGYIPAPEMLLRQALMNYADNETYLQNKAIQHPEWDSGRIDFAPWPYPSATRLIVQSMTKTLIGNSDVAFLQTLDPEFVTQDLVDYAFVRQAMQNYPGWEAAPGIDPDNPFDREEVIIL